MKIRYVSLALILLIFKEFTFSVTPLKIPDYQSRTSGIIFSDSSLASSYFTTALQFHKKAVYDSSVYYFNKAERIYSELGLWNKAVDCLNIIGNGLRKRADYAASDSVLKIALNMGLEKLGEADSSVAVTFDQIGFLNIKHGNFNKAIECGNKSLSIRQNIFPEDHSDLGFSYSLLGLAYHYKGEFNKALNAYNTSLSIRLKSKDENYLGSTYNGMAQAYASKGDHEQALNYYKKSLEFNIKKLGEHHPDISIIYNNIGTEYFNKGDSDQALEYYFKALSIDKESLGENHPGYGFKFNNIAMAYRTKGEYDKALEYGEKSKAIFIEKLGAKHQNVAALINNIARIYFDKGEYDKALNEFKNALSIWEEKLGENHPTIAQAYYNIGETYFNLGYYKNALKYLNKSLQKRILLLGKNHPKVAQTYNTLGETYLNTNKTDEALRQFQNAIEALVENFNDTLIYSNPQLKNISSENELLKSLILKAKALGKRYHALNETNDLLASLSTIELGIDLIDMIRRGYKSESAKLLLGEKALDSYESAIHTSLKLFEATGEKKYEIKAYNFAERSKANILLDAIAEADAKKFSGIPDSLLDKERNYKIDLSYLETQLNKEKEKKDPDTLFAVQLQNDFFDMHQKYLNLIENMEEIYPDYYELKHQLRIADVDNIQMQLPDDQTALLEYFIGEKTLYIFNITRSNFRIEKIYSDEDLSDAVKSFRHSLQNLDFENYISSAVKLYNILIKPIEKNIQNSEKLFIIPDGILFFLPFEALLTKKQESTNADFANLPYLLNNYEITYHFSSSFLINDKIKKEFGNDFGYLGFAPVFSDDQSNRNIKSIIDTTLLTSIKRSVIIDGKKYSELPESEKEVAGILDLFKERNLTGTIYTHSDAIEDIIKSEEIKKYKFLHLATHGFINEQKPKLSGLVFNNNLNDSTEDGVLYSGEIYNLNLNAELVVLSACESGLGKIVKGEGIIGLTRGFIYSGAKNIVVSLWQVADKSTSELMIEFYKNILDGMDYSSALRIAKLNLIKDGTYSYPLEWSPFILIGK